jgi:FkbM family methyltransferase
MTPTQEAIQAWRQLLSELGSAATMRSGGDAGQRSAHRVNAVRELYYKVLVELRISKHLEIGSMHADASRRFMQANPLGKAIAYEAAPRNYEKALAKPCPSGMRIVNSAIGSMSGTASFFVPNDDTFEQWGSLRRRLVQPVDVTEIAVPMVTLEEAAEDFRLAGGKRDLAIWMDVEGAALEVLESGLKTLGTHVSALYLELCDDHIYENGGNALEVLELLISLGFVPVARDNQFKGAWNILLLHESSYLRARGTIGAWLVANSAFQAARLEFVSKPDKITMMSAAFATAPATSTEFGESNGLAGEQSAYATGY